MNFRYVLPLAGLASVAAASAHAAAGTTCLCRSADGKAFVETVLRHHRWACDFQLGYAKRPGMPMTVQARPAGETCNMEEVAQFKVWLCISRGCVYPYVHTVEDRSKDAERIDKLEGKRTP